MELITCVITTYKRPIEVLKRAVDSVIAQTYKNIELIVVNDAPQDNILSEEIRNFLNNYRQIQIKYLVHKKNMGACQARNTAIEHAQGKYIAFLDDDDEWLPEKIAKQYKLMKEKNVSLVYCSHYEIDRSGKVKLVEEELATNRIIEDDFQRLLCENYIGSTSYPLIELECIKYVGGFNIELKSSQDYELWLRITKKFNIEYLNEPLVKYYITSGSISDNMKNKLQGFNFILNEFEQEYKSNNFIFNYKLNYLAFICLKKGNFKEFINYYFKALKVNLFSINNFIYIRKIILKMIKNK